MGLLCSLRGHEADAAKIVWNGGICFGACVRCGTDLVRTISDRWQVPRGYKVVWRAKAEEQATPVAPEPVGSPVHLPDPLDSVESGEPLQALPEDAAAWVADEPEEALQADQAIDPVFVDDAMEPAEGGASDMIEWPLSASADLQADDAGPVAASSIEPAAEAAVMAEEPPGDETSPEDLDFMDDGADGFDWSDFPEPYQRSATG